MNKLFPFIAFCCAAFTLSGQSASLKPHLWKNRLLLIFADTDKNPLLLQQSAELKAVRKGLEERDMVLGLIIGDRRVKGLLSGHAAKWDADELRERYGKGSAFRVVLIGKDGGVKRTQTEVLGAKELFGVIDAMPMRRQEQRERGQKR